MTNDIDVDPYRELQTGSKNFWAFQTGQETPPPPSYREVNGKQKLGRYMDPWGCEFMMQSQKARWKQWYMNFLVGSGLGLLGITVDGVFLFLVLPICAAWYLLVKRSRRRKFEMYRAVLQEILRTEAPQWVAYDKKRLRQIDENPRAVFP